MEDGSVRMSQVEHRAVVGAGVRLVVRMSRWPLIIVKREAEDIASQEASHIEALIKQIWEVLLEEEGRHMVVLVLHNVVDDVPDCSYLVVPQGPVHG